MNSMKNMCIERLINLKVITQKDYDEYLSKQHYNPTGDEKNEYERFKNYMFFKGTKWDIRTTSENKL